MILFAKQLLLYLFLNLQIRIVGFPCQGSDKITQVAGGVCSLSYSDVVYEPMI